MFDSLTTVVVPWPTCMRNAHIRTSVARCEASCACVVLVNIRKGLGDDREMGKGRTEMNEVSVYMDACVRVLGEKGEWRVGY